MRTTGVRRYAYTGSLIGVAAIAALNLSACGSDSDKASGSGGTTKITIVPSHLSSASNAAVLAGVQTGLFKKCGFDVTVKEGGGGGDTVRTITSGAGQFAFPSVASAFPAYLKGSKLAIVAGQTLGTNGGAFLVKPNSTLNGVASLAGKKVGISAAGSNNATELDSILKKANIDEGSVKKVVVGEVPAGMAALAAGAVDATWATEPDVTQLVKQGKAKVLLKVDDYIKNYQLTVVMASQKYVQSNPDVVKRFVSCLDQANAYTAANPDAAGAAFAKQAKLDNDVAVTSLKTNLNPNRYSVEVSAPGLQEAVTELVDGKVLPAGTQVSKFKDMIQLPAGGKATVTGGSL